MIGGGRPLRRLAAAASPCGGSLRFASTGRRDFFQRINEQYLARELEGLSEPASRNREQPLFNPKVRLKPVPRATPPSYEQQAGSSQDGGTSGDFGAFASRRRTKPWLHYESLRGSTYPTGEGKAGPRWQDLTHGEAQRLQEMYMRKRMLDRKILWLKMSHLPNPEKEAKMTLRRQKEQEEQNKRQEASGGLQMYPPPFLDVQPTASKISRMEDASKKEELESRFRARIREEKLENARILKANVPDVGGIVTDPIKRHVNRRLVRQRVKIHAGLEDVLTRNTAQILYEHMGGVAISIVKVFAKRPRQTQEIHYNLSSDHDPAWVQKQLDILAPKLRSQLAVKVNMGQTPNIRFVPHVSAREIRRAYLYKFARKITKEVPVGGGVGANFGVG